MAAGGGHDRGDDGGTGAPATSPPPAEPAVSASTAAGIDDRPLHRLARGWWWAPWLLGGLLVLRFVAVAGLRLYVYFDSGEYDTLDFSGRWRRPWAVPFLYRLIPGDDHRIVVVQAAIGALCWGALALSAAAWFRLPRTRLAVAVTLATLGCTTGVTNWDAAKLSESLAVSLTVLLVAAWLDLLRRPEVVPGLAVVAVAVPWLFVRQSLLAAGWLLVALAVVGVVSSWRRGGSPKVLAAVAVALALLTGLASLSYGRNQEVVRENLTVIVANRIATDPGRLSWFVAEGMPIPASGAFDVASLKADPAFSAWVAGEGRTTYARYLLGHPWYALTEPLDDFVGVRRPAADADEPQSAMLAPLDAYATSRPVVPDLAERALNQPGDTGTVLTALLVATAWSLARWRRRSLAWVVPAALVAVSFASLYTGWHGATPELGRLGLVGALGIRIGLVLQLALLVEGEQLARKQPGPVPSRAS